MRGLAYEREGARRSTAHLKQEVERASEAPLSRYVHWRLAFEAGGLRVSVGSMLEQHPQHPKVASSHGNMQGCAAEVVSVVYRCAHVEQSPHHPRISALGRLPPHPAPS